MGSEASMHVAVLMGQSVYRSNIFNIFFYVAHGWLCHNNFFLIRTTVVVMLTVVEIRVACPFPNIPRLTKY